MVEILSAANYSIMIMRGKWFKPESHSKPLSTGIWFHDARHIHPVAKIDELSVGFIECNTFPNLQFKSKKD